MFESYNFGPWPVAGKTGTADSNTNVWFVGYTRQLATAVWVGSQGNPYPLGSTSAGTSSAAPLRHRSGGRTWPWRWPTCLRGRSCRRSPRRSRASSASPRRRPRRRCTRPTSRLRSRRSTRTCRKAPSPSRARRPARSRCPTSRSRSGSAPASRRWSRCRSFRGMSLEQATAVLAPLHLFPTVVEVEVKDKDLDGTVLFQRPAAGTPIAEGSSVHRYERGHPGARPREAAAARAPRRRRRPRRRPRRPVRRPVRSGAKPVRSGAKPARSGARRPDAP